MADKIKVSFKYVDFHNLTQSNGMYSLPDLQNVLAVEIINPQNVYATGITNYGSAWPVAFAAYNYDGTRYTGQLSCRVIVWGGGVIPTLLLALSGAGVWHERQADSTKYTNMTCTRNKFCRRRREVFRRNFSQKIDRSKSSLHSYVPKWVGRIRFGTSHISSGYKFYLLCKEQFIYTVDDWLRLDSRWIDGLAVKAA